MSEHTDFPDDEIVSAVLDGVAGPLERERVEQDPALRDRLVQLAQVRAAVAAPVGGLDELTAHRLRSRAIEAVLGGTESAAQRPLPNRLALVLAGSAAALVLVALVAIGLFGDLGGTPEEDVATEAFRSSEPAPEASGAAEALADEDLAEGAAAEGAEEQESAGDDATGPADGVVLGDFASFAELETAVETARAERLQLEPVPPSGLCATSSAEGIIFEGFGSVAGRELLVRVFEHSDGSTSLAFLDVSTCEFVLPE